MLTSILNGIPPPRCIIIQDYLALSGNEILFSIIQKHLDLNKHKVHFFAFQTKTNQIRSHFTSDKLVVYDCTINENTWVKTNNIQFDEILDTNTLKGVIIIDSLAHVLFDYGLGKAYQILHKLMTTKEVLQISTILHEDAIENKIETIKYFDQLSTLSIKLHDIPGKKSRVYYTYKKAGGKIIKEIEEFYFGNDNVLHTNVIDKINRKLLLQNATSGILPENMSTFKISLDENEKISREHLVLPYIKTSLGQTGGNVIYKLDDDDDWDEEDPDDDLDF